jgi:hypothetical protein
MRKAIILAVVLALGAGMAWADGARSGTLYAVGTVAAHASPTVALVAVAGVCTAGVHYEKVAYVTAVNGGISTLSAASGALTVVPADHGQINVTVVASTNPAVTSINIYMTLAGGSTYYLATNVANSGAVITINQADATLLVLAPTTDTASADTIITATPGKHITHLWLRNNHATERVWVTIDGTIATTSATTADWLAASGGLLDWFCGNRWKETTGITSVHLRGETTAPTVSYRIGEE